MTPTSPAKKATARATKDVEIPDKVSALSALTNTELRKALLHNDDLDTIDVEEEIWARLTKPFPEDHVERLPKPLSRNEERKGRCDGTDPWVSADGHYCNGWHSRAVHLDYIGHAGITTRLNDVLGPGGWTFEPYALTPDGIPGMTNVFWARLTILDVTKWDCAADYKSPQEAYGDALRRCAMRFGIGTYLWSKSDYALAVGADPGNHTANAIHRAQERRDPVGPGGEAQRPGQIDEGDRGTAYDPTINTPDLLAELDSYAADQGLTREEISAKWRTQHHGGMPVEFLDDMEPHALLPLVESIRQFLANQQKETTP